LVRQPCRQRSRAKYLETHARRAYGCVTAVAADTAKAILAKIRTGALGKEFGSRDVWRPGWSQLSDREVVDAGLQMLVDYDWLDVEKVTTGGRPQTVYKFNPKAKL
jgi:putative DNA primase/helicase